MFEAEGPAPAEGHRKPSEHQISAVRERLGRSAQQRPRLVEGPERGMLPAILTIVVPTYNECENLRELVSRVDAALAGLPWEIIFVDDDSPDMTWRAAKAIARSDERVRCLRRIHRRGLAGACIEGILASSAPFVAVMDGDLQHDEMILPRMLKELQGGEADLVIGSRYIEGGETDGGFSKRRAALSRFATRIAWLILGKQLKDPMSGFFMIRREPFETIAPSLGSAGFKLLADIIASAPNLRIREISYSFRPRLAGQSKLDISIGLDFLGFVLNKLTGGLAPARFVFFALTGLTGLALHLLVLRLTLDLVPAFGFNRAQALAAFAAMTSNFFVNNLVTYRDARLRGMRLLRGLAIFYLVCSAGVIANVGVAGWVYQADSIWWLAGLSGAAMGSVWNYSLSTFFIWKSRG